MKKKVHSLNVFDLVKKKDLKFMGISDASEGAFSNESDANLAEWSAKHLVDYTAEDHAPSEAALLIGVLVKKIKPYQCESCQRSTWFGNPIALQVKHRNGKNKECQPGNLVVFCCNCAGVREQASTV